MIGRENIPETISAGQAIFGGLSLLLGDRTSRTALDAARVFLVCHLAVLVLSGTATLAWDIGRICLVPVSRAFLDRLRGFRLLGFLGGLGWNLDRSNRSNVGYWCDWC